MSVQQFSKGEALRFGWQTMKENFLFLVNILMMWFVVSLVPSIVSELLRERVPVFSIVMGIVGWILQMGMCMGTIKITLKLCDGEGVKAFNDLFSCFHLIFKYFLANVLYLLIILIGMIFFIIPGIIFAIKLQFYGYFLVDKGLGPINAMESSWKVTKGIKWDLCIFGGLLMLINILGMFCLVIGLFCTIPMTMVAIAFVYRRLSTNVEEDSQILPESVPL